MYEVGKPVNFYGDDGELSKGTVTAVNGDTLTISTLNGLIVEKKANQILSVLTESGLSE